MLKQFNYERGNYKQINKELKKVDWEREFTGKGVEEMWKVFLRTSLACRDRHIPTRERREKGNKVWMKPRIMKMI